MIKRDLNKTRINGRHQLLLSFLRIKIGLKLNEASHSPTILPTKLNCQSSLEVEGILHSSRPMVLFSQHESL